MAAKFILKETFVSDKKISDNDYVRLCIRMLMKQSFMGKHPKQVVDDTFMHLLEDFSVINEYPWGSRNWELIYSQLEIGKERRSGKIKPRLAYTLLGFVWAFKVTSS